MHAEIKKSKKRHSPAYSQSYRFLVTKEYAGFMLIEFLTKRFSFRSRDYWLGLIEKRDLTLNRQGTDPNEILKEGDLVHTIRHDVQEPDVNDSYEILYEKDGLFIVNKPAPLPVHPAGRYYKNSLTSILRENYPDKTFHTIHRLDLWTTGVLILATELESAKKIHDQVEAQKIQKNYAVLAKRNFSKKSFEIHDSIGRKQGTHRGTGDNLTEIKESCTHFEVLAQKNDLTLLKAVPITGRTNQIRVHVQSAGGFVLNDPLYSPNPPKEDEIDFIGLHCREMQFIDPSGERLKIQASWPDGFLRYFSEKELSRVTPAKAGV